MELNWRQTRFAWIAILPDCNVTRGQALERPVEPAVKDLCECLLGVGGQMVAVLFNESPEFCEAIVLQGQITPSDKIKVQSDEERQCHRNSALIWSRNKTNHQLVTGFALSDDQMWRRHSWILTTDGVLIETTAIREMYFGLVLDNELAEKFVSAYI